MIGTEVFAVLFICIGRMACSMDFMIVPCESMGAIKLNVYYLSSVLRCETQNKCKLNAYIINTKFLVKERL